MLYGRPESFSVRCISASPSFSAARLSPPSQLVRCRRETRKDFAHLIALQKLRAKVHGWRIGRPPKDEAAKKGAQLSIRISAGLRERLDAARQDSETERSLSQEA